MGMVAAVALACGCAPGADTSSSDKVMTPYTSQATVALSADEYRSEVNRIAQGVNASLAGFSDGLQAKDLDRTIQALAGLVDARDEAAALAPPAELAQQHEQLMIALNGYRQFAQTMTRAYTGDVASDAERAALVEEGGRLLEQCGEDFSAALESLGL